MRMRPFGHLLDPEVARRRVLRSLVPVRRSEEIPLDAALGRVADRSVRALRPIPSFDRATWDGYALRSADTRGARAPTPVRLRVVGEIFAEDRLPRPLAAGEAAAIATGGCLPRGADAVEIFERVRLTGFEIQVSAPVRRGNRVARPGSDFAAGAPVVAAGEVLTPAALGGLAATGHRTVAVRSRPRVAIVPNGNELVPPGEHLGRGQIYESNNQTLAAVVRAAGGEPIPFRPVPDEPERLEAALRRALAGSDLVLATGGSSVGERDYLPVLFPKIGTMLFHGLAIRPGKPTLAARAGPKLLLGLPGHPTSCLANGLWLLLPVLRRLAGLPGPGWTDGTLRSTRKLEGSAPGVWTVVPFRAENGWGRPTFHDSSAITSLAGANAFALLPPGRAAARRGDRIPVHYLAPPLADAPAPRPAPGQGI